MGRYLRWGGQEVHPRYGTEHFLVAGASGSGKTLLINALLRSVFEAGRGFRAMVYDPKQEVLPGLYALAGEETERVRVLHPFDARCQAWDLALDIDGPVSARQFATILVPDEKSGPHADAFFIDAVRDLLVGVFLTFVRCVPEPGAWTFRDVVLTMLYEPYLRFLLQVQKTRDGEPFPLGARLMAAYIDGDPRTVDNIRATINTKMSIYEPVAAVWEKARRADRTFSLSRWVERDCRDVLVLGNDEAARAAIDAINRAIFKRATELLLAGSEVPPQEKAAGEGQTWFFLDEVREAGALDGLSRLLTKGRSKGACIVLGFQDIDGMRDAYGREVAQEVCGQCNNVAVLKLNNPSTAEWASQSFGERLAASQGRNRSIQVTGGLTFARETGEQGRPWVYTSDFLYLPPTSPRDGLHGYFRGPDSDPDRYSLRVDLDWQKDIAPYRLEPHPDVAAQEERGKRSPFSALLGVPPSEHYLEPWNEGDWERLGLDRIVTPPVAYNAPSHRQPQIHTETRTLRPVRR